MCIIAHCIVPVWSFLMPLPHQWNCVRTSHIKLQICMAYINCRGGVVSAPYFREQFGLLNPNKTLNKSKSDNISANVVSVLQAGAFFGSLGSAPLSCECR